MWLYRHANCFSKHLQNCISSKIPESTAVAQVQPLLKLRSCNGLGMAKKRLKINAIVTFN